MTNTAIVGAQWGDEGKGKVVDHLADKFAYVIRFQGGHNAGHTVVFNGERYALHVLPSGIFHPGTVNVIANGVVVDPFQLVKEIKGLREKGIEISPANLKISDRAHLIMPYHGIIDRHSDSRPGHRKIGTTGRGIGPTYESKVGRRGFRFCDIMDMGHFHKMVKGELADINQRFPEVGELRAWDADQTTEKLDQALAILRPFVTDAVYMLAEARSENKRLLFEGAQATLLDVDFGTYPYVTSSNSCAAGICAGAGVPPTSIQRVIGIFKAYQTRVGGGPFPTELEGETCDVLRRAGQEFGTTTGRPRRCGWLDLVALRYALTLNGFQSLAMMKLDVLDSLENIKVCVGYRIDGEITKRFPASAASLERCEPIYETLPGWQTPVNGVRRFEDLPAAAREYIAYIEEHTGSSIGFVSVGPDREQSIIRDTQFFH